MESLAQAPVRLRDVTPEDSGILARWKSEAFFRRMSTGGSGAITPDNQREDIRKCLAEGRPYWIIEGGEPVRAIGYIRLDWLDPSRTTAWLRFGLGEERGKGYAKEALRLVLRGQFAAGLHRMDAEVFAPNAASIHLLSSLGFRHEGTRRLAHPCEEGYCDVLVFGLLEEDWNQAEAAPGPATSLRFPSGPGG